MGCDIHALLEVKIDGEWYLYNQPDIYRDYALFSKMAGVRGGTVPVVEPKGFPKDASKLSQLVYEHWGADAHTPSWLTETEMEEVERWYYSKNHYQRYPFGYGVDEAAVKDSRLVFWFDN